MTNLLAKKVSRKSGDKPFIENGSPLSINLLSFWKWSASDLVGNVMRGILAEYIVASAVKAAGDSRAVLIGRRLVAVFVSRPRWSFGPAWTKHRVMVAPEGERLV